VERAALEEQVLLDLINSRLIVAKAGRLGIEVSFGEIEKHVDQTIEENKRNLGGEAAFIRALEAEGLTLSELKQFIREQIRNRMLVERVLASEIDRGSLRISDAELLALYDERKDTLPMRPAVVHLKTIYISMESSQSAQAQAKARIDSIYGRVVAGEDFADLARRYSEDPSGEKGGALGRLKIADLNDPAFADAARGLSVGEVSEPVLSSFGYHLIKMTGADPANDDVELSHILIRVNPGDDDIQEVFKRANMVHDLLVKGAPFDSTAMRYSDDRATAENGGDLGWLRVADLPDFFRDVLKNLNEGDISPVLREPAGFRIVQLVESEDERPYQYEEVADDLRKLAEQEKLASAYDGYLKGLRDEFYVDVRGE
jgi:peptidyl-prolyl cis-trans isomerase SurA